MELGRNIIHDKLTAFRCPDCGDPPMLGVDTEGNHYVRCSNPAHTNLSQQGTEARAVEEWNFWVEGVQKQKAARNPKDHFWFLRLRADVLKCCGDPTNIVIEQQAMGHVIGTCGKCNRRHHQMNAEPGLFRHTLSKPATVRRILDVY